MIQTSTTSDAELVRAWQAGHREAGATLFQRHYDGLLRFFRRRAGGDAEDLAQRTFLACEESKTRIRGTSTFRTFLFAVARRILSKHRRTKRRRDARTGDGVGMLRDPSPSSSAVMATLEEHEGLAEAMHEQIPALRCQPDAGGDDQ